MNSYSYITIVIVLCCVIYFQSVDVKHSELLVCAKGKVKVSESHSLFNDPHGDENVLFLCLNQNLYFIIVCGENLLDLE